MMIKRNALRRVVAGIAMAAAVAWTGLAETVTNVRGRQRENSNLIDIYYDIEATDGGKYTVKVEIEGRTNEVTAATFTGDVGDGIAPGRNRHILWNAGADWPGKKGDVRVIVTATKQDDKYGRGVQLWEGGPYWADRNVGASRPEDYGLYFWWGDTVGYTRSGGTWDSGYSIYSGVTWVSSAGQPMSSSPFSESSCPTYYKDNSALRSAGYIDSTGNLVPAHDAAHVHWGGAWRMPTDAEFSGLVSKCTTTWTTRNGVYGRLVTGKGAYADRSIFLPAAGYGSGSILDGPGSHGHYWSSTPNSGNSYDAWFLFFDSSDFYRYSNYRFLGRSVRPVRGFAE